VFVSVRVPLLTGNGARGISKTPFGNCNALRPTTPLSSESTSVDDAFTADLEHAKAFLRLFNEGLFDYDPGNQRQADQLDDEFLHLLSKNCSILPIGVESADETVFKAIGKGETLEDIKKGILKIQSHGITPWLNMIVGLPKDTFAHHFRSVDWCTYIPDPKIVHWFQYAPFRGTRAYDYFLKQGCFEDGFIPSPYGRRYDELPWEPDFETRVFQRSAGPSRNFTGI